MRPTEIGAVARWECAGAGADAAVGAPGLKACQSARIGNRLDRLAGDRQLKVAPQFHAAQHDLAREFFLADLFDHAQRIRHRDGARQDLTDVVQP